MSEAKTWIDFEHPQLSVREQGQILGLHRSNVYYDPIPDNAAWLLASGRRDGLVQPPRAFLAIVQQHGRQGMRN